MEELSSLLRGSAVKGYMSFLIFRADKKKYRCNVLIGESTVTLTVYEALELDRAKIFYEKSMRVGHTDKITLRQLYSLIASSVYRLFRDFETDMRKKGLTAFTVAHITFYYTPPFSLALTKMVEKLAKNPSKLTSQVIESLLSEAEDTFLQSAKESSAKMHTKFSSLTFLERRISDPKLDGYPVTEYLERSFTHFSARIQCSAVPTLLIQKLTEACQALFSGSDMTHRSVLFAVLDEIYNVLPQTTLVGVILPDNAVLIYSERGVLLTHHVFKIGERALLAHLAHTLSTTQLVAQSYAMLYQAGTLQEASERRFVEALRSVCTLWTKSMLSVCQLMGDSLLLPKDITLVPSSNLAELVCKHIDMTDQNQPYRISVINSNLFPTVGGIEHVPISPLDIVLVHYSFTHKPP